MGMSNTERQRKWMEKNRAAFNLRRRNARKSKIMDEKKEVKLDEDSGSMLCPGCGGYEAHGDECMGKPVVVTKQETLERLRKLIEEPRKPSETLEEAPVIEETRSASDVARGVYRNDHGGVISKGAWDKLQKMKVHAKEKNFVIDDYSQ